MSSPTRSSPWPLQPDEPRRLECPHCGSTAHLTSTESLWRGFAAEALYLCPGYPGCDTYVRCHAGTNRPLGTLAGPRLRRLRKEAHDVFDPLWNQPGTLFDRDFAYRVAGDVLGIPDFHIGFLDEAGCRAFIARIDEIDEAISAEYKRQHGAATAPDQTMLEILAEVFRIGGDDQTSIVHADQVRQLGSISDNAVRSGLLQFAHGQAKLSPFGLQLLTAL
jgi:hypothetical protein